MVPHHTYCSTGTVIPFRFMQPELSDGLSLSSAKVKNALSCTSTPNFPMNYCLSRGTALPMFVYKSRGERWAYFWGPGKSRYGGFAQSRIELGRMLFTCAKGPDSKAGIKFSSCGKRIWFGLCHIGLMGYINNV